MSIFATFRYLLVLTIVLFLLTGLSVYRMNAAQKEHYQSLKHLIELKSLGQALANGSDFLTSEVRRYVQFGDRVHFENFWREVNETRSRDKAVKRLKELGVLPEELAFIEKAKHFSDKLIDTEKKAMNAVQQNDFDVARKLVFSKYYDQQKKLIMGNIKLFQETTKIRAEKVSRQFHEVMSFYILLSDFLLALSAALVFYLVYEIGIKKVINPLKSITREMKELAEGKLDNPKNPDIPDNEIGDMKKAIEVFRQNEIRRTRAESELGEEKAFKELIRIVAVAANEMPSLEDVTRITLSTVSITTGWPVGHLLILKEDEATLVSSRIFHAADLGRYGDLHSLFETIEYREGEGLPGRVLKSGQPESTLDVSLDEVFPQASRLEQAGLFAAVAFPVMVREKLLAVIEFFMPGPPDLDLILMKAMSSVGIELGRVIERQQAEQRLQDYLANLEHLVRERTKELERSNHDLADFASIASHDLSEPLRKVIILGDCLRQEMSTENQKARDFLDRMQKATQRMQGLIDNLLKYSMVATQPYPFEEVDLAAILHETKIILDRRLKECRGTVSISELPTIEAYPAQMRQLFQNLVGNSLKYHRAGVPPVITVTAQPFTEGRVQLMIEDNGIGMEEKYWERIFRPFQRLHSGPEYEGTGMGLAICKKIVERHNGVIMVQSQPGYGTTFIIQLPLKQPAPERREIKGLE